MRVDWKWVCDGDISRVVEWDRRESRCKRRRDVV